MISKSSGIPACLFAISFKDKFEFSPVCNKGVIKMVLSSTNNSSYLQSSCSVRKLELRWHHSIGEKFHPALKRHESLVLIDVALHAKI